MSGNRNGFNKNYGTLPNQPIANTNTEKNGLAGFISNASNTIKGLFGKKEEYSHINAPQKPTFKK